MSATTTRSGSGKMARHLGNKKKSSSSITSGAAPTNETHAEDKRRSGKQTRRPLSSTSEVQQNPQEQSQEKDGATEMERELIAHLASSMKDCSRQRLRALQMALRRITNVDARISSKELHLSFQEQNIKINSRTFQLLTDLMGDGQGVQYDKLWTCLENAQFTSGRDSVLAQRQEGNVAGNVTTVMSRDERDADFTRRLVLQLTGHTGQYDLVKIRKKCQVKDKHKVGKLARAELEQLIVDGQVPVYGALLNNLLNRCDEEKTNQPSWPEFLDFLEQAHRKITGEVRQAPRQSIKVDPDQPKSPRPGTALSTASNASERTGSAHVTSAASAKRRVSRRRRGSAKSFTKDKEALDKPATDNPSKKNDQRMIDTTKDITKEPIKAEAVAIDEPVAKETIVAAVSSGDDRAHSKPTPESDNKPSLSGPVAKQLVKDAFKKALQNPKARQSGGTALAKLRKSSGQVKSATGFLTSMRSLITAKQRGNQIANQAKQDDPTSQAKAELPTTESINMASTKNPTSGKDGKPAVPKLSPTPSKKSTDPKSLPKSSPNSHRKAAQPDVDAAGNAVMQVRGKSITMPIPDAVKSAAPNTDPPKQRIKLEWVYGYSGNDSRSNIHTVRSGELVYHVGSVVVLLHRTRHAQRHYREHTHHIKCLTVHANGVVLASGQGAAPPDKGNPEAKAQVRVWRSDTLQTLHILGVDTLVETVLCVSFSKILNSKKATLSTSTPEGATVTVSHDWVCAIDKSKGHTLMVSDVSTGKMVARGAMDLELVCDCDFSPHSGDVLVVIGKEHIGWWRVDPEKSSIELIHTADYQSYLRAKYITSLIHTEKGDLVTGDSNGTVYVWGNGGNVITNLIKHAHDGPVFSLLTFRGTLLSGGRDSMIHGFTWGKNMDQTGQLKIPADEGGVRMLVIHEDELVIGTTTNSILTALLSAENPRQPLSDTQISKVWLTQGHFDQTHSICAPRNPALPSRLLTAGQDGNVCMYDAAANTPVWKCFLKGLRVLCADINSGCTLLAVGTRDFPYTDEYGNRLDIRTDKRVLVYGIGHKECEEVELTELCRLTTGTSRLTTISLSPDCDTVAVGDKRGRISVYGIVEAEDEGESWEHLVDWQAHSGAAVSAIDWSMEPVADDCDEFYLRTCSSDSMELRFWHSDTGEAVKDLRQVRNTPWASHHCAMTYDLYGMWFSKQAKDACVNCVSIHPEGELVCMGDSNGYLSLFRYPCISKGAFCHTYRTQREVVSIAFSADGRSMLTLGGSELCVMQWALTGR